MPAVVAKFQVQTTKQFMYGSTEVALNAVHATKSDDPKSENYKFWQATPTGQITLNINNADAAEFFQPGDFTYVTFEKADGERG